MVVVVIDLQLSLLLLDVVSKGGFEVEVVGWWF